MVSGLVSVIIPTHKGAEAQTARLVDSINASTYKDVEIIVVNEGKERSVQRNIGLERATGSYFFIPDSDWFLTPGLIQECVGKMKHYDALYIPEKIWAEGFFAKVRDFERQFYTGTLVDCVRFVKREFCPFFDCELTGPEDASWDLRVLGRRGITKNYYYHMDGVNFFRYLQKKAYYSKSMRAFERKNPNAKVLSFKYRCWTVFTEQGKWKKLIRHPFLALCVFGLLFIRGVIYLTRRGA